MLNFSVSVSQSHYFQLSYTTFDIRLGKVSGFTGSVRCMGLNRFYVMQISIKPAFISKPDPGIPQQQHVLTPSGRTSADMAVKTVLFVKNTELLQHYFITTGLFHEHRHDVVNFSNVSWTSTRDTEQKLLAVVYDKKWRAPPSPEANVTS